MDSLQIRLTAYFDGRGDEVDLTLIHNICKAIYDYYGDLEERCRLLEEELRRYQLLSSELYQKNSELILTVKDTILKYQEIIAGAVLHQEAEKAFMEREARELEI